MSMTRFDGAEDRRADQVAGPPETQTRASGATLEALFQVADRWRRCETLRGFVEAVRQGAVEEVGSAEADPKIVRWLAWAERGAARQGPPTRLRRSSPKRPT